MEPKSKPIEKPVAPAMFRTFNNFEDNQYRDKYGFTVDDVSLADAFALEQVRYNEKSLPEN